MTSPHSISWPAGVRSKIRPPDYTLKLNLCSPFSFYLTPLLIALAYFLAKPLPTKSS